MRPCSVAAALLCLLTASPAPSTGEAQVAVMGSTIQEHAAAPGESYSGTILVLNPSALPQAVRVYQTDYLFYADGTSHFDPPGSQVRSNAGWVAPGASQLTVAPGATVPVHYSVQVPDTAALTGTYWSMLMVETVPPAASLVEGTSDRSSVGLTPTIRYGIQVVTHLKQTGTRQAEFVEPRVTETPEGLRLLQVEIRSTGERAYPLSVKLQLFDSEGTPRGTFEQERGLLYPSTSALVTFDLSSLPPEAYQALIIADTGEGDVFGAQYTLRM